MRNELSFWGAVALLVGTQIGAGILGLPSVLSPLGFFWSTVVLFFAAFFTAITAIMLVEALYLSNPNYHYFDLSSKYLGRWGKILTLFILYAGYGALVAYISGLSTVLSAFLGGDPRFWAVLSWVILSMIVFLGLRISGAAEETLSILLFLLLTTIVIWSLPRIQPFSARFSFPAFFVAFSVAVFAYFGHTVVPEVVRGVRNLGRTVLAILTAFSIVFIVYTAFSLSIMGALGGSVPDIGVLGLSRIMDPEMQIVAYLFPLLTITTSFIGVGISQRDILREIFRNKVLAWLLAVAPPLIVYLAGVTGFVSTIFFASFGTLVAAGIIPPLVLRLARKERGRALLPIPEWLVTITLVFYGVIIFFSFVEAVSMLLL